MLICIRRSFAYRGTFSAKELSQRRNDKYKLIKLNNRSVAIRHHVELDNINIRLVRIIEEIEEPLWKRSIELQLNGRDIPKREHILNVVPKSINQDSINRYRFEVYDLIK